ncbi:carbonic anhydrase [Desmospora profundinema]|uniref:Carbonic anhydrase n=1 Tax=Desmospora profundinema TaxID=1571184 RepID=A0ABU1II88_9BACL|nr:carbonic anhydrase [Desmospora profundinema]MDR6224406.1 carbonic anhydrase [Desmospora profundinema]
MKQQTLPFITLLWLFIIVLTAGCGQSASQDPQEGQTGEEKPHWSYGEETGPEHWGELSPAFSLCNEGKKQSPIDITQYQTKDLTPVDFNYKPSAWEVVNNGHTIQANVSSSDNTITVDNHTYLLNQFHFHTPSEHTINDEAYAMELHLVHQDENENIAVVGLLIQSGKENTQLASLWENMPQNENEPEVALDGKWNVDTLLPKDIRTYRYSGSLTTPPCSEGVQWLLIKQPIELSEEQIQAFQRIFPMNSRPVQPLYNRDIIEEVQGDR